MAPLNQSRRSFLKTLATLPCAAMLIARPVAGTVIEIFELDGSVWRGRLIESFAGDNPSFFKGMTPAGTFSGYWA
jgi:hypothetical protein